MAKISSVAALLDHLAAEHDDGAVGDLGDHAHVVGDEQDAHALLVLQLLDELRICAWIVTSSAVVGSSAISSCGRQASAMAIITRWRMPPEKLVR